MDEKVNNNILLYDKINKIRVIQSRGLDKVFVFTNLPNPVINDEINKILPNLCIQFEATNGVDYSRKFFKIEPDVVVLK